MHGVALLLAQIAVILATSRLLGSVLRRIGQPMVVAEIVAGLALGPSLLGLVWPEALAFLFPAESRPVLEGASQLGLVLFMFLVGLELDLDLLRTKGRLAATVSLGSILAPLLLGAGFGWFSYARLAPPDTPREAFALFLGTSMAVTAFPVLARILGERGLSKSRIGALALAAAAVNDAAAWCLLAFVIAVIRAHGGWEGVRTTALTLGYVGVMLFVVRPVLARVERRFGTLKGLGQTAVAVIVILLMLSSIITELIGIHALFGAFLFGAALPRENRAVETLTHRLEDVVVVLLLPLFFASTGLKTDLGLLASGGGWGWFALVTVIATVGKLGASWILGRVGGMDHRSAATLGVLMNTRGLMELVILSIGLELGVLGPEIFAMMVLMAVATTFVTAPLVALLYPSRRALAETEEPPAPDAGFTVLAAVSHPESALPLAAVAAGLAGGNRARVIALRLVALQDDPRLFPDAEPTEEEDAADLLARRAGQLGAKAEAESFRTGDPVQGICDVATLSKAGLVLLGLHRPLVGTARLGGPVVGVATRSPSDVAILHTPGAVERAPNRVLLALGGGPHDAAARRVAERFGAANLLTLDAASDPRRVEALVKGAAGYDLVVLGVGPEWGLPMSVLDFRESRLLEELKCPVLMVHGGSESQDRA